MPFIASAAEIPILSCRCPVHQLPSSLSFSCPEAPFTGPSASQVSCPTYTVSVLGRSTQVSLEILYFSRFHTPIQPFIVLKPFIPIPVVNRPYASTSCRCFV